MKNNTFLSLLVLFLTLFFITSCGSDTTKNIAQKWQLQEIDATDEAILQTFIPQIIPDVSKFVDKLPAIFKERKQDMTLSKFKATTFHFKKDGKFVFEVHKKAKTAVNQGTWKVKDNALILEGKNPKVIEMEVKKLEKDQMVLSTKVNFQEITLTLIPSVENE